MGIEIETGFNLEIIYTIIHVTGGLGLFLLSMIIMVEGQRDSVILQADKIVIG